MAVKNAVEKDWTLTAYAGRHYSDNQSPLPTPGAGEALMQWDARAGATGYRVYYNQDATESGNLVFDQAIGSGIDAGNVLYKLITGLAAGTWYFAVTAYDANGYETEYSDVVSKVVT